MKYIMTRAAPGIVATRDAGIWSKLGNGKALRRWVPLCLCLSALSGQAATINVNAYNDFSTGHPDYCSLREAIIAVNTKTAVDACPAGDGADTINLPAGTYTLTVSGYDTEDDAYTGDVDIKSSVTIQGAGAATTIIVGNDSSRVFDVLGGTVAMSGLTVTHGYADDVGGAIQVRAGSSVTISECTFSGNRSGAHGGAIYIFGGATLSVSNSTFTDNHADPYGGPQGGAISNHGTLMITNSTFSGNSARNLGGAIFSAGSFVANGLTIASNSAGFCDQWGCTGAGGGILLSSGGSAEVRNTLVAGNTGPAGNSNSGRLPDCSGTITSGDYNLIQDLGDAGLDLYNGLPACTLAGSHNITGQDPLLDPLEDNGGPTPTRALQAGSPAIDAGSPDAPGSGGGACAATDQRGVTRTKCDIGAFEVASLMADQTITVTTEPPLVATYGDSFTVAATASSSLPVSIATSGGCAGGSTSGSATIAMTSGTTACAITFDQAGNSNYNAASQVTRTVTAQKAGQTILVTQGTPATAPLNATFTVAATASGGGSVVIAVTGSCSLSGATVTMTSGSGNCVVTFDQPGDANYAAAAQVVQRAVPQKLSQTIIVTRHAPATTAVKASFSVAAIASSGEPVRIGASGACSAKGNTVTAKGKPGACTVTFDQAGNKNYFAAPQVVELTAVQ